MKTRDFYLSSYLIANGMLLLNTVVEGDHTQFVFQESSELNKLIASYYSLKSRVEPMAYGQAIRTLKSVIHASRTISKSYKNNGKSMQFRAETA